MKYMGSKSRIVKDIIPIIQNIIDTKNIHYYYEPFVGGCNVIDKVKCTYKIGNDINSYLIKLLKAQQKGLLKTLPAHVTKEHYNEVRNEYNNIKNNSADVRKFEDWYIGAIGFLASYNGKFFDGGYSGVITEKTGRYRDFYNEAKRNLEQQDLQNILLYNSSYQNLSIKNNNLLIYCDPPYFNTKQYNYSKNFDYAEFWNWVREQSKNNIIIVSEQTAPEDFKIIWEQPITRSIGNRTLDDIKTKDVVEKLFTL